MLPADSPFAPLPAPGPHPATAELRAYAAGTLAPAAEHRLEAHALDCERCAELLEGFAMSDAPTTDRAVAGLRTRLQARLGQAEPAPAAGWPWPRLAAAAALLAVVGTGLWGWEQHAAPAPTAAVARVGTAVPAAPAPRAPKPAAAPAASSVAASPPVAAASSATKTAAPATYAAVVAPAAGRSAAARSRFGPPAAARAAAPGQSEEGQAAGAMATAPTVAAVARATQVSAVSADDEQESKPAGADAAPAAKSEGTLSSRAVADSASSLSEVAMAAPAKQMKALVPGAASATVPNTAMPAGFTIKPAPVGGTPAFRDYLRREASQFEPEINNLRLSGIVRGTFTVGADGQLSNLKVTRGLRADYDEEALRLVCDGPKWQPGIAGGRRAPLPVEFTVPF